MMAGSSSLRPKKLTTVRGGHFVCLEPGGEPDKVAEGHVAWVDSYADDDFQLRAKYTPVLKTGINAFR